MPGRIHPLAQYLMVLALMIGAYSAYARFAVPMIKGPANQVRRTTAVAPANMPEKRENKTRLLSLLPSAAWELGNCKTLFTSQGTLLFQEMERLDDDGNYALKPFTMIMHDHGSGTAFAEGLDPNVPPTVLRCGEAKLKFDGPIVLTGGAKTRMQAALLGGEVTIFRPSPDPQQNETLKLITQNVQVSADRIFTLGEVAFSFGPHRGSGKNLTIELTHEAGASAVARDFSSINGLSNLKLATLNSLLIEPGVVAKMSSTTPISSTQMDDASSNSFPQSAPMFSAGRVPVEIFCKGPFEFDYLNRIATFNEKVYVEQKDAFGDNLNCDKLLVEFAGPSNGAPDGASNGSSTAKSMGLKRLRAIGDSAQSNSATLIAHSRKMKVTGDEIAYHAAENQISCSSATQVLIVSPELNVKAQSLSYQLNDNGSLGELEARGPGECYRKSSDPKENFFTRWKNRLTIRQRQFDDPTRAHGLKQKLIVIDGEADVIVQETTHVASERLSIAMFEIPNVRQRNDSATAAETNSPQAFQYLPAEIFADDAVTIRSTNLDGEAEKLLVTWTAPNPDTLKTHQTRTISQRANTIQRSYTARKPPNDLTNVPSAFQPVPQTRLRSLKNSANLFDMAAKQSTARSPIQPPIQPSTRSSTKVAKATWVERESIAVFDGAAEPKPQGLKQYVRFRGKEVRLKIGGDQSAPELVDLQIDGDVVVHQYEHRSSKKRPLRVSGNRLRVVPQAAEIYRMLVSGASGKPAIVDAQGLLLSGAAIHLDQESNKIWVDGAGEMQVRQATNPNAKDSTNANGGANDDGMAQSTTPSTGFGTRNAVAPTGDIDLQWAGGMVFDGAKIYFERNVMMTSFGDPQAKSKSITKTLSQALSVALAQKVNFRKISGDESIGEVKMAEMVLVNHIPESMRVFQMNVDAAADDARFNVPDAPIIFQNETFGPTGKLVQQRRIAVPQATINVQNNMVVAAGPGKIFMHVVPSESETPNQPGVAQAKGSFGGLSTLAGGGRRRNKNEINYLQVNFEDQLVADLSDKQLEITGNIRTVFAPVKRFSDSVDPDGGQRMPDGALKMECAKMLLSQWQPSGREDVQNEMLATGNVHITSAGFDSVSQRLSYNDGNDQVVIEGTVRSPARLFHRPTPRSEKQEMLAKKIIYHPSTGMAETQGVQSMNVNVGR